MKCDACENDDHDNCGMQTWCDCDCDGPEAFYHLPEPVKSCSRCNAGMPSFRANPLCEECFAEESDEYDGEVESD